MSTDRKAASIGLVSPKTGKVVLFDGLETVDAALRFQFGPFETPVFPLAGDWNGDGLDSLSLYSPEDCTFRIRDSHSDQERGHRPAAFGQPNGQAVSGDWSGKGMDGIGVYYRNNGTFLLRDEASNGMPDRWIDFGKTGEIGLDVVPIAGRFHVGGVPGDSIGIYDRGEGVFHLRTSLETNATVHTFSFGPVGERWWPVVADWNGEGIETIGLFDPAACRVHVRFENQTGDADRVVDLPESGAEWIPIAGRFAGIHGEARDLSPLLGADGHLRSSLWIDQHDAVHEAPRRCSESNHEAGMAQKVSEFINDGYTIIEDPVVAELAPRIQADVDRLWEDRPEDLLIVPSGHELPIPFSEVSPDARSGNWRIPDIHSHSESACELYLSAHLHRIATLLFGEPAVAISSLYFPRGSEQGLHRDPWFVVTDPPSHLIAAWIALEDVSEGAGPLVYIPGSHQLPYVATADGGVDFLPGRDSDSYFDDVNRELEYYTNEYGLKQKRLACKQSEILLWHGSLFHGGAPVTNPDATRKSLVVHFSTLANCPFRVSNYQTRETRGNRELTRKTVRTKRLIGQGTELGIDNPLRVEKSGQ